LEHKKYRDQKEAKDKEYRIQQVDKKKVQKEKDAADKKYFSDRDAREAVLQKSCQAKVRAFDPKHRRFTPEEKVHYRKWHGGKLPKGC
jgi:hypothetical protein